MDFHMKLPRSKKEFLLFLAIISIISVNLIAPLITFFEQGFHFRIWLQTIRVIPFIWCAVVMLVLLTYAPAEKLTSLIVHETDSFGSKITINILCTVLLMSVCLTVIGTWIGSRHVSLEPLELFFYKWPRNFAISFGIEACIAQPIARKLMQQFHIWKDSVEMQN